MRKPKKPWAILLTERELSSCVWAAAREMVGSNALRRASSIIAGALDRPGGRFVPTPRASRLLARSLRVPAAERAGWVADRATGDIAEEVCSALAATYVCSRCRGIYVVDLAWAPGLAGAIRGSRWTRLEPQEAEQAYAGWPRLADETLRGWWSIGGHPDLGRYLAEYLAADQRAEEEEDDDDE